MPLTPTGRWTCTSGTTGWSTGRNGASLTSHYPSGHAGTGPVHRFNPDVSPPCPVVGWVNKSGRAVVGTYPRPRQNLSARFCDVQGDEDDPRCQDGADGE